MHRGEGSDISLADHFYPSPLPFAQHAQVVGVLATCSLHTRFCYNLYAHESSHQKTVHRWHRHRC